MAVTTSYLNTSSRNRSMTTESNFSLGMKYTDTPLDEGYSRVLLNYALSDNGSSLKPRSGLEHVRYLTSVTSDDPLVIHHCETALFEYADNSDATMCKYLVYGTYNSTDNYVNVSTLKGVCFYNGAYLMSTSITNTANATGIKCTVKPKSVHGMELDATAKGMCAVLDGNAYVITDVGLALLKFKFNSNKTAFTITIEKVNPNTINAAKAVNNGYNMLLDNPYNFSITSTSGTAIIMDGIVPYDSTGTTIKMNARIGDEVQFKLFYRYPTADAATKKYYAQWELQDLETGETRTLARVRDSIAYTPGNAINFTTNQTTYKQFTLICKLFYKDEVDAVTFKSDALDAVNLKPVAVMSIAYYYFTDTKGSTQNSSTANYDLTTATGIASFSNRLVLWGVSGCKNTVWFSEVNDPSYFPYPNNIEIFDNNIIGATKLKSNFIVFTDSTVVQMSYDVDGTTLISKVIQDRMTMEDGEACTIIPVQNMVFFKNDNYYYMIVPSGRDTTSYGDLTLAPVSKPITELLDNFRYNEIVRPADNKLYGYDCYLEGSFVRIMYKLLVSDSADTYHFEDFILQYDTKTRTWTTLSFKSDRWMWTQFIRSVTADSVFAAPVQSALGTWTIDLLKANPAIAEDDYNYTVYNSDDTYRSSVSASGTTHVLDTGYRKLNDFNNLNKKWRQIQFEVNNYGNALAFSSETCVDNWWRYPSEYDIERDANDVAIYPIDYVDSDVQKVNKATAWGLDGTKFCSLINRVKINTIGKGKYIRFRLSDNNTTMYSINAISYVYRIMTGR